MKSIDLRLDLAKTLAIKAGDLICSGFGTLKDINHKGAFDLVTEFDLAAEKIIVSGIQEHFPEDAILSEEGGSLQEGNHLWIVDPLDGTTNFTHNYPAFSVSIACAKENQLLVGVVYQPYTGEMFHAKVAGGSWLNQDRLSTSSAEKLADSLLGTGISTAMRTDPEIFLPSFTTMLARCQGVRRSGSAALDLAYVAAGRLDGHWELGLNLWDVAAGALLIREAGGRVTRYDGSEDILGDCYQILATNGKIHQELQRALQEAESS
jgi:myo-inositol-1(or 4)-monophosphatase